MKPRYFLALAEAMDELNQLPVANPKLGGAAPRFSFLAPVLPHDFNYEKSKNKQYENVASTSSSAGDTNPAEVKDIYWKAQDKYHENFIKLYNVVNDTSESVDKVATQYHADHRTSRNAKSIFGGPNKGQKAETANTIAGNLSRPEGLRDNPGVLQRVTHSTAFNDATFKEIAGAWGSVMSVPAEELKNLKLGKGKNHNGEDVSTTFYEIIRPYEEATPRVNQAIEQTAAAKAKLDLMRVLIKDCNQVDAIEARNQELLDKFAGKTIDMHAAWRLIYNSDGAPNVPEFSPNNGDNIDVEAKVEHIREFKIFLIKRAKLFEAAGDIINDAREQLIKHIDGLSPAALKEKQAALNGLINEIQALGKEIAEVNCDKVGKDPERAKAGGALTTENVQAPACQKDLIDRCNALQAKVKAIVELRPADAIKEAMQAKVHPAASSSSTTPQPPHPGKK